MKRRTAEVTKNRKYPKRTKFGDGSLGVSIFLAVKLLVIWMVIVALDFAAGFRLEYFWPVWLMLQSVVDAYKYQGIGFTVFFNSMVVTSDILVYMFVPTSCMFFLASLYVWIQLMMLTGIERGVCVQTVVIWMVFLYIEATMRLRELKPDASMPFHWDICRPFAAHCVGYPLVTFSFSVKSFVGFKYRKHKQLQIASENKLFRDLINEALPEESRRPLPEALLPIEAAKSSLSSKSLSDASLTNGFVLVENGTNNGSLAGGQGHHQHSESRHQKRKNARILGDVLASITQQKQQCDDASSSSSVSSSVAELDSTTDSQPLWLTSSKKQLNMELDNCDGDSIDSEKVYKLSMSRNYKNNRSTSPSAKAANLQNYEKESVSGNPGRKQKCVTSSRDPVSGDPSKQDLYVSRMENDIKRLRAELQISRQLEQDLRSQVSSLQGNDKSAKSELTKVQQECESLQQRLNNLVAARQQDKQNAALIEKKYNDEKKSRLQAETQLAQERKQRKAIEDATPECGDVCKTHRKEMETELRQLRRDLANKDEKMRNQGEEINSLKQYKENMKDADMLVSAFSALQDKNTHLENSLGAETKLKLDLFSALGEAKRQVEVSRNIITERDKEIGDLNQRIARLAEAMTLVPTSAGNQSTISAFVAEALKHQTAGHRGGLQDPHSHIGYN